MLKAIIDLLSYLKMNQLHLYMEHTFAYADHRVVWQDADPYTPEGKASLPTCCCGGLLPFLEKRSCPLATLLSLADVLEIDEYCAERGIALVPNQNSCGHFHRFLKHDRYRGCHLLYLLHCQRQPFPFQTHSCAHVVPDGVFLGHLAECPDGIDFGPRISGPRDAPFSLCPTDPRCVWCVCDWCVLGVCVWCVCLVCVCVWRQDAKARQMLLGTTACWCLQGGEPHLFTLRRVRPPALRAG